MTAITILRGEWRPAIRPLAPDQAVAAVGDVHGQDDLFAALAGALAEDLAHAPHATFVQLGDLVDRGPGGVAALRRAKAGLPGVVSITLKGNHEDRLVTVLDTDDAMEVELWRRFGGEDVAAELGVTPDAPGWRRDMRAAMGEDLVGWVRDLPALHRVGDLVFVHAGLNPDLPLGAQDRDTLIWTRRPWLDSPGPYAENVAVLHGHTPRGPVDLTHPHRINLDTGAFKTGLLSGLLVAGDRMRLVQAAR